MIKLKGLLIEDKAEKYFDKKRQQLKGAKNVDELLNIMVKDIDKAGQKSYKSNLQRTFNKKFKGDFKKIQKYCIKLINEYEHNYYSI